MRFDYDNERNIGMYPAMRQDPLSAYEIALAQQNPESPEYKRLIEILEIVGAHEACEQLLLIREERKIAAEMKAEDIKQEKKYLKEEEKEKREAAIERNEEIAAQKQEEVKTVVELHRELAERVSNINELDQSLYQYEHQKEEVDLLITEKDQEIKTLEEGWYKVLAEEAKEFISENFVRNEDGRLVSTKNPEVKLLSSAEDVIKKAYTDAKSPAEMQKHNPHLIENPERMMQVDDVRKDLYLARKVDKIVDKNTRDKQGNNRKIVLMEIVFNKDGTPKIEKDDAGNPVIDPKTGKPKIMKRRVEITPQQNKLKDANATDESRTMYAQDEDSVEEARRTKSKNAKLVCLGDVCFLRDEVISKPISHSAKQAQMAAELLQKGSEKSQLEKESQSYAEKIVNTKEEIAKEKDEADQVYTAITDLHPELQEAPPMQVDQPVDQLAINVNQTKKEEAKEKPQLKEAERLKADAPSEQTALSANKKSTEELKEKPQLQETEDKSQGPRRSH